MKTRPDTREGGRCGGDRARDLRDAARASGGDVAAFSRLVERHSGLVRGVALRVVGADDADDACQEAWVRAWRHAAGFRGDSAFGTWLYRIATNACLDHRRSRLRRPEDPRGDEAAVRAAGASGGDSDPEASVLRSERRREVRTALGRVRADHRAALVLRHAEGLSYAEIAKALDVPDGTAKGWVSRGRLTMLRALSEAHGTL